MEEQDSHEPRKKVRGLFQRYRRRGIYFVVSLIPLGMAWSFANDYTRNRLCGAYGKERTVVIEKKYLSGRLDWKTFDFRFKGQTYSCLVNDSTYLGTSNGEAIILHYSERADCFCDVPPADKSELISAIFFTLLGLVLLVDCLFPFFPSSLEEEKETH